VRSRLPYPPPYQDLTTLAEHICTGESTIEHWVKTGQFPAPRKIGGKRLWVWKEVEKHIVGDKAAMAPSPDSQAEAIREATRVEADYERHIRRGHQIIPV
jgi:predicted DNA-binding transcriptional regulator AlpA